MASLKPKNVIGQKTFLISNLYQTTYEKITLTCNVSFFITSFGGGGGGRRTKKGTNLRVKLKLTLSEIANGVEKKIKVKRQVVAPGVTFKSCSSCQGSGQVKKVVNTMLGQMVSASTCGACGGSGQLVDKKPDDADSRGLLLKEEVISITIPGGVGEGM